ncbi:uncharacterized protein LOC115218319 isoform X12 [Octopus sinensis]|uniref:Uncharacterized protein LOC115218319 isoform X12 n=1 Tax=Octopus sinensis TaxID=2607531 RepID=A0A7E6EYE5_9MOLL|nr:uncharacterized protein LOC115218319 isoform X12 [Octopus sinensis]
MNPEIFRICQQIGCYNENPRPYPPPINSPPGNFPPVNYPPGNFPPGNSPTGNSPPGNSPPVNYPPVNYPPVNYPPGNFAPGNSPPGNSPPGNSPPVNYPPGNYPPGIFPPGIFPGNSPPVNFPPGNSPPVNFPPVNFPPVDFPPGNSPPVNFPPGNYPPGNFPPGIFPPVNSPPVNSPPVNSPPVNTPPVNTPPVDFPPVDYPPGNSPPVNFPPGNYPPGNFPPGIFPPVNSPPVNSPPVNTPPVNAPPVDFPPVNYPPVDFPSGNTPPVNYPPVPPYYDSGPYSRPPPSTFPQAFPPTMYPSLPPFYDPGPHSPPMMQPSLPFVPHAPATGPPYYGFYPSYSWHHHSAPVPPHHTKVPAPIKEEAANLTYPDNDNGDNNSDWLIKGFDWPGWQVVASNASEVALLKKGLKKIVDDAGQSWKARVSKHFKEQKKLFGFLNKLNADFNKCNCIVALSKWLEAIGLSANDGTYFKNWLNDIVKPDKGDNSNNIRYSQQQQQQQSNYNPYGFYGDPYLMYNPHYFNSDPYAPSVNNMYDSWSSGMSYPLTFVPGTIYPNIDRPYSNQHQDQWPVPSKNFDAASQDDKKPIPLVQQNSTTPNTPNPPQVLVTFNLKEFNVLKCTINVTKQSPAPLEDFLTKASQTNSCFEFTTVFYINNPLRQGKYLNSINGINVTATTTWEISKENGPIDLNLGVVAQTGDTFTINNTSV